jgi:hypothetical protein
MRNASALLTSHILSFVGDWTAFVRSPFLELRDSRKCLVCGRLVLPHVSHCTRRPSPESEREIVYQDRHLMTGLSGGSIVIFVHGLPLARLSRPVLNSKQSRMRQDGCVVYYHTTSDTPMPQIQKDCPRSIRDA